MSFNLFRTSDYTTPVRQANSYQPPPGPPPSHGTPLSSDPAIGSNGNLNEELPPAYTVTPDATHGEETLDVGPRRPFQQPESRPTPYLPPAHQQHQQHPYHNTPPHGWSAYPGQYHHQSHAPTWQPPPSDMPWSPSALPPPPPRHPYSQSRQNSGSVSAPDLQGTTADQSDFAREFYAAGGDVRIPGWQGRDYYHGRPTQSASTVNSSSGSSSTSFQPPPGMPPSLPPRMVDLPDDGRPTTTPQPGHPLLHNGKMLVYPIGYTCRRCENTGYMQLNPSNPCTKCWGRHAKPYAGALTYAPTTSAASSSNSPSQVASNWQRPLPHKKPLAAVGRSKSSSSASLPTHQRTSSSLQVATSPTPVRVPSTTTGNQIHPPIVGRVPSIVHTNSNFAFHDPNAVVLRPGDPRLGGRVCYNCKGDGQEISFTGLLFGSGNQCRVCVGTGRLY